MTTASVNVAAGGIDREHVVGSMLPLHVDRLKVQTSGLSISKHHVDILREKYDEFTKLLQRRRLALEEEYRTFAEQNDVARRTQYGHLPDAELAGPPDLGGEMRNHLQEELNILYRLFQQRLDYLFRKFEKEWQLDPREKISRFPLPKSGTEAVYLGEQLGEALGRALAEICVQRPDDPIEYLGLWLKKYSDNMKHEQQEAIVSLKVRLGEEEALLIKEQQALLAREREQIKEDEERRRRIFLEQAKEIEDTRRKQATDPQSPEPQRQDDDEGEERLVGATKRVTVADPENSVSLYTIEEKDSTSGNGDDDGDGVNQDD